MPDLSIETLLISIAFILPGFLTSRLVISKIPAPEKQPKPFVEITESLLRSTYINLIIGTVLLFVLNRWVLSTTDVSYIIQNGIPAFVKGYQVETITLVIIWLVLDFLLAAFFGAIWDPLESLYTRLHHDAGTNDMDLWHILRDSLATKTETNPNDIKIWAKARLKNGNIYLGGYQICVVSRRWKIARIIVN